MKLPKAQKHGSKYRIRFTFYNKKYTVTATTKQECQALAQQQLGELLSKESVG